jgi:prevent-host-death family protein
MKRITISASDAANNFSQLIARVHYGGERIVIVKHRRPFCELVPIKGDDPPSLPPRRDGNADSK